MDTENPQIICPGNLLFGKDSGQNSKSNVAYTVTATDNCVVTNLTCEPPSGSTFAVGTNVVNCTVQDSSGNSAGAAQTNRAWLRVGKRNPSTSWATVRTLVRAAAGAAVAVPPVAQVLRASPAEADQHDDENQRRADVGDACNQ